MSYEPASETAVARSFIRRGEGFRLASRAIQVYGSTIAQLKRSGAILLDSPDTRDAVFEGNFPARIAGRPVKHMKIIVFGDFGSFSDVFTDLLIAQLKICALLRRFA